MSRIAVDADTADEGLLNPHGFGLLSSAMRKCFYRSLHSNRTVFRSSEVCAAFAPRSTLLISGCGRVLDLTMISSAGVIAAVV